MDKKFCASIFVVTFITLSTIVYAQNRSPSVSPIVEVDIEDVKKGQSAEHGYDFSKSDISQTYEQPKKRAPANIVTNHKSTPPFNYLGPILFLLTLPFAVWIIVAKKFNTSSTQTPEKTVEYFPKTYQFNPYKTDYQKSADEDDDINYPKAS
jgi:hypothetical protein